MSNFGIQAPGFPPHLRICPISCIRVVYSLTTKGNKKWPKWDYMCHHKGENKKGAVQVLRLRVCGGCSRYQRALYLEKLHVENSRVYSAGA
jgi:hypothetical protein